MKAAVLTISDGVSAGEREDESGDVLAAALAAGGWEVERREGAVGVHLSRASALSFVRQKLQHGAGGGWVDRHHPGALPPRLPFRTRRSEGVAGRAAWSPR